MLGIERVGAFQPVEDRFNSFTLLPVLAPVPFYASLQRKYCADCPLNIEPGFSRLHLSVFRKPFGTFRLFGTPAGFQVDRGQRHRDHRHIKTLKGLIHNPFIPPVLLSVGVRCSANLRRSVQCSLRIRRISHRCAAPSRRIQNRYDRDHHQQLDQREAASSHT